jgi:hypothetical protein
MYFGWKSIMARALFHGGSEAMAAAGGEVYKPRRRR